FTWNRSTRKGNHMKRLSTVFLTSWAICTGAFAQNNTTEKRQLASFEKIALTGDITLTINVGPAQSIEITPDAQTLKNLETTVEDKELAVSCKSHCQAAAIAITVPMLERLEISGSLKDSKITGLKGASFELDVSGT